MSTPALKVSSTSLPGVLLLQTLSFSDDRGLFTEIFNQSRLQHLGITCGWPQVNLSRSGADVLRGLHFQFPHPQAKLLRVLRGSVFDVTLDLRPRSRTFGKWQSLVLVAEEPHSLFVPAGFAHGFCTLDQDVEVIYACSDTYHPECERGILWNDPDLAIPWPCREPQLSPKDRGHPPFHELLPWLRENLGS